MLSLCSRKEINYETYPPIIVPYNKFVLVRVFFPKDPVYHKYKFVTIKAKHGDNIT